MEIDKEISVQRRLRLLMRGSLALLTAVAGRMHTSPLFKEIKRGRLKELCKARPCKDLRLIKVIAGFALEMIIEVEGSRWESCVFS